jgi:predicted HTH transcriptional regulator
MLNLLTVHELLPLLQAGEDSVTQFKADITNADSLAAEMVAFSNTRGGSIYIGVSDTGKAVGIPAQEVGRINQLVSNAASQHIKSPIAVTTSNLLLDCGKIVVIVQVPEGLDKPYFDKNGVIWLKNGADKRRIHSKEELRRLFQSSDLIHADAVPTSAGLPELDTTYFSRFFERQYRQTPPDSSDGLRNILKNMNLASGNHLNLAGLLLFAKSPQFAKPAFICKAIHFPGNDISVDTYLDSEDFEGRLEEQFKLPNHLTIPQIESGNSNIRNPVLASFAYKGILPYRGLGTGIRRALDDWPHITFEDDREGNQFKVTVLRSIDPEKEVLTLKGNLPEPDDPEKLVINQLQRDPETSYMQLAQQLGVSTSTVKRLLQEMKQGGKIARNGGARGGSWQILQETPPK